MAAVSAQWPPPNQRSTAQPSSNRSVLSADICTVGVMAWIDSVLTPQKCVTPSPSGAWLGRIDRSSPPCHFSSDLISAGLLVWLGESPVCSVSEFEVRRCESLNRREKDRQNLCDFPFHGYPLPDGAAGCGHLRIERFPASRDRKSLHRSADLSRSAAVFR